MPIYILHESTVSSRRNQVQYILNNHLVITYTSVFRIKRIYCQLSILLLSRSLQMDTNLEDAISLKAVNHPYFALVIGSNVQLYLVVEILVVSGVESMSEALLSMIASYYAFDMSYPKNFNATLLCTQQLIMSSY